MYNTFDCNFHRAYNQMTFKHPNNNAFLKLSLFFILGLSIPVIWYNRIELHLWTNQIHHITGDIFFPIITHLGSIWFLLIGFIFAIGMRSNEKLLHYSFAILIGGLGILLTKYLFFPMNLRPLAIIGTARLHTVEEVILLQKASFISGHSTIAFTTFYFFSLQIKSKIWQAVLAILAIMVAISRVYLSQHFWIDVWGGAIWGISSVSLAYYIGKTIIKFKPYNFKIERLNENI